MSWVPDWVQEQYERWNQLFCSCAQEAQETCRSETIVLKRLVDKQIECQGIGGMVSAQQVHDVLPAAGVVPDPYYLRPGARTRNLFLRVVPRRMILRANRKDIENPHGMAVASVGVTSAIMTAAHRVGCPPVSRATKILNLSRRRCKKQSRLSATSCRLATRLVAWCLFLVLGLPLQPSNFWVRRRLRLRRLICLWGVGLASCTQTVLAWTRLATRSSLWAATWANLSIIVFRKVGGRCTRTAPLQGAMAALTMNWMSARASLIRLRCVRRMSATHGAVKVAAVAFGVEGLPSRCAWFWPMLPVPGSLPQFVL